MSMCFDHCAASNGDLAFVLIYCPVHVLPQGCPLIVTITIPVRLLHVHARVPASMVFLRKALMTTPALDPDSTPVVPQHIAHQRI